MSSRCKQCGEKISETGNYTFKILPAKRVPKKAQKLIKARETANGYGEQSSSLGTTKFQKFLLKRSKPSNFIEITCGKCGGISKIKMLKNVKSDQLEKEKNQESEVSLNVSSSLQASSRKKRKKDKSAGLTLPVPMEKQKSTVQESRPRAQEKPSTSAQRKKELEKLNKMLFNSKKAKRSGSTLQDFLSSI